MKPARISWLFALAMMISLPAWSWVGPLTPAEPTTFDRVSLEFTVGPPSNGCDFIFPGEVSVSRDGGDILIEYTLRERTEDDPPLPPDHICLGTYVPPYPVIADLGALPAGDFDVAIAVTAGDFHRSVPSAFSFTVLGGPIGENLAYIPASAPWALSLMLLALGGVAVWRLRVR